MELFDDTIEKKLARMDKWMAKLQKQLYLCNEEIQLLRQASYMKSQLVIQKENAKKTLEQLRLFGT